MTRSWTLAHTIWQFTSILVVTSNKVTACSVFALQARLQVAHVNMAPLLRDQLNAKDADMEQALLLCYIVTKVLVICRIVIFWVITSLAVTLKYFPYPCLKGCIFYLCIQCLHISLSQGLDNAAVSLPNFW